MVDGASSIFVVRRCSMISCASTVRTPHPVPGPWTCAAPSAPCVHSQAAAASCCLPGLAASCCLLGLASRRCCPLRAWRAASHTAACRRRPARSLRPLPCMEQTDRKNGVLYVQFITRKKMTYLQICHWFVISAV